MIRTHFPRAAFLAGLLAWQVGAVAADAHLPAPAAVVRNSRREGLGESFHISIIVDHWLAIGSGSEER